MMLTLPGTDVMAPWGEPGAIQVEMKDGATVWTSWAKARIKAKK
jgi:hypothetical protein